MKLEDILAFALRRANRMDHVRGDDCIKSTHIITGFVTKQMVVGAKDVCLYTECDGREFKWMFDELFELLNNKKLELYKLGPSSIDLIEEEA